MTHPSIQPHAVVSREQWLAERRRLLAREKDLMRQNDELAAERRALPWVRVEKPYLRRPARTADARRSLRRSQPADRVSLHVRPGSEGRLCRLLLRRGSHRRRHAAHQRTRHHGRGVLARADRADRAVPTPHGLALQVDIVESQRLQQRLPRVVHERRSRERSHVLQLRETLVPVGRRGARTERFLQRRDRGIFHTYSAYARGLEVLDGAYHFIDLAPKGRDEEGLPFPGAWWRHHDRYAADTIQARHAE